MYLNRLLPLLFLFGSVAQATCDTYLSREDWLGLREAAKSYSELDQRLPAVRLREVSERLVPLQLELQDLRIKSPPGNLIQRLLSLSAPEQRLRRQLTRKARRLQREFALLQKAFAAQQNAEYWAFAAIAEPAARTALKGALVKGSPSDWVDTLRLGRFDFDQSGLFVTLGGPDGSHYIVYICLEYAEIRDGIIVKEPFDEGDAHQFDIFRPDAVLDGHTLRPMARNKP